jgi:uncharacterized small protein (DUF1192 family)
MAANNDNLITYLNNQIQILTDEITRLRISLIRKMTANDNLITYLNNQIQILTDEITRLRISLNEKDNNSSTNKGNEEELKDNNNVIVSLDKANSLKIPIHKLQDFSDSGCEYMMYFPNEDKHYNLLKLHPIHMDIIKAENKSNSYVLLSRTEIKDQNQN